MDGRSMSPALIDSFKVWSLFIFQFSHIWLFEIRPPFIFIKSRWNTFLTCYISLNLNYNFWIWVDQLLPKLLKRVCRESFSNLALIGKLDWDVRRPQNLTRQFQVYCSVQALCHSSDVTDALWWGGRRPTGSWGFGVFGVS